MKDVREAVIETVAQIKAGSKALDEIEEVLQRNKNAGNEVCPYCGATEEICPACGVCAEDHIMLLGDAFAHGDPQKMRDFGINILIAKSADTEFHGPPVSVAMVYIADPDGVMEALNEEYEERKQEVQNLDMDVWGDAFSD